MKEHKTNIMPYWIGVDVGKDGGIASVKEIDGTQRIIIEEITTYPFNYEKIREKFEFIKTHFGDKANLVLEQQMVSGTRNFSQAVSSSMNKQNGTIETIFRQVFNINTKSTKRISYIKSSKITKLINDWRKDKVGGEYEGRLNSREDKKRLTLKYINDEVWPVENDNLADALSLVIVSDPRVAREKVWCQIMEI